MNRSEVRIDAEEFQKSITKELDVVKDRVRNLISHWGEEGRYKEAILKNVIGRFLPSNISIGTGFVVKSSDRRSGGGNREIKISSQIDIIVYDNTIPALFSEGDFIITTYKNVKGIIEVKTRIRSFDLINILTKPTENGKLIGKKIFNGIFSYEYDNNIDSDVLENCLRMSVGYVNHLSLGKDIFIKYWKKGTRLVKPVNCDSNFYNIYELEGLSFSYFISNLLTFISDKELDDRDWFLFPIEGTKEMHRKKKYMFIFAKHRIEGFATLHPNCLRQLLLSAKRYRKLRPTKTK